MHATALLQKEVWMRTEKNVREEENKSEENGFARDLSATAKEIVTEKLLLEREYLNQGSSSEKEQQAKESYVPTDVIPLSSLAYVSEQKKYKAENEKDVQFTKEVINCAAKMSSLTVSHSLECGKGVIAEEYIDSSSEIIRLNKNVENLNSHGMERRSVEQKEIQSVQTASLMMLHDCVRSNEEIASSERDKGVTVAEFVDSFGEILGLDKNGKDSNSKGMGKICAEQKEAQSLKMASLMMSHDWVKSNEETGCSECEKGVNVEESVDSSSESIWFDRNGKDSNSHRKEQRYAEQKEIQSLEMDSLMMAHDQVRSNEEMVSLEHEKGATVEESVDSSGKIIRLDKNGKGSNSQGTEKRSVEQKEIQLLETKTLNGLAQTLISYGIDNHTHGLRYMSDVSCTQSALEEFHKDQEATCSDHIGFEVGLLHNEVETFVDAMESLESSSVWSTSENYESAEEIFQCASEKDEVEQGNSGKENSSQVEIKSDDGEKNCIEKEAKESMPEESMALWGDTMKPFIMHRRTRTPLCNLMDEESKLSRRFKSAYLNGDRGVNKKKPKRSSRWRIWKQCVCC